MGPVELEVESKGEGPVLIDAYSVGFSDVDIRTGAGMSLLMFDFILY
jgi:hypothetical protein